MNIELDGRGEYWIRRIWPVSPTGVGIISDFLFSNIGIFFIVFFYRCIFGVAENAQVFSYINVFLSIFLQEFWASSVSSFCSADSLVPDSWAIWSPSCIPPLLGTFRIVFKIRSRPSPVLSIYLLIDWLIKQFFYCLIDWLDWSFTASEAMFDLWRRFKCFFWTLEAFLLTRILFFLVWKR